MITLVQDNIQAIQDVCRKHHVKYLYLFGSSAGSIFTKDSDIDFLYEIDIDNFKGWDTGTYDYTDNLDDLETELRGLLKRKIDLIPYNNIHNKYFKESVDLHKQLVYGSK